MGGRKEGIGGLADRGARRRAKAAGGGPWPGLLSLHAPALPSDRDTIRPLPHSPISGGGGAEGEMDGGQEGEGGGGLGGQSGVGIEMSGMKVGNAGRRGGGGGRGG